MNCFKNIKGKKWNDFLKGRTNFNQFLAIFSRNTGEIALQPTYLNETLSLGFMYLFM